MDPKTLAAARRIPGDFRELMNALFEESRGALKEAAGTLNDSLGRLQRFVDEVEQEYLGGTRSGGARAAAGTRTGGGAGAAAGARGTGKATKKAKRGRRSGGRSRRFAIAEFVAEQLRDSPGGLRPREIADRLEAAGGGANALSRVNTTLFRLKQQGTARSQDGQWVGTGGGSAAKSPAKRGAKRGARKAAAGGRPKGAKRKAGRKRKARTGAGLTGADAAASAEE